MCRLELDEFNDVRLLVLGTWVFSALLHLLATEVLETDLKEVDSILVLNLVQEKTDQVLKLLVLQSLCNFLILNNFQFFDADRES